MITLNRVKNSYDVPWQQTGTWDCSGCSAEPGWRPCSDTAPQTKPWVSADRSVNSHTGVNTPTAASLDLLFCLTHNEVLDDFWASPWLFIHFGQHLQHVYSRQRKHYISHLEAEFREKTRWVSPLPSTASPRDIFFRYIVMSAALSDTEADMLTRGRELEDTSSGKKHKERFISKVLGSLGLNTPHSEITSF